MDIAKTQEISLNLGKEEYIAAVEHQAKPLIIPLCSEISLPSLSPVEVYQAFAKNHGFILESMEGSEKIAQYSFVGFEPELIVSIGESVHLTGNEPFVSIASSPEGISPIDRIGSILQRFNYVNVKAPRFFGGMVGYFAYDCIYPLFPMVTGRARSVSGMPLAQCMLVKDCIVFDHKDDRLFIFSSPFLTYDSNIEEEYERSRKNILRILARLERLGNSPNRRMIGPDNGGSLSYTSNMSKEAFEAAVLTIKDHIYAGDIFQAVLSRRIECELNADPIAVYQSLREINPSPYMYYLDFGDMQIVGSSPEMLVRVERRRATTVPIAGTRVRGRTPIEDENLAAELLSDEKECAEHAMLVDLARNDLGRVCKFGSLQVSDFMSIEKFSHVQHIVSTVQGNLQDNLDCYDALKSCFPAGTVSGAPKIRAMQIIDEVEPDRRGIYAGATGYVGFDRNLECAITIRTIVIQQDRASIQVGAGIVADSIPEKEWEETENKGRAMLNAIRHAEGLQ